MRQLYGKTVVTGLLIGGVLIGGVGVYFGVTRLDDADKWGSVIGAVVALIGLMISVYGLVQARGTGSARHGGQSITDSDIGGSTTQVRNVGGSVRFGGPAQPAPKKRGSREVLAGDDDTTSGQSVNRSSVAGPVRMVDGVGVDVDVDVDDEAR